MRASSFGWMRQAPLWLGAVTLACTNHGPASEASYERSSTKTLEVTFPSTSGMLAHARRNPIVASVDGFALHLPLPTGSSGHWRPPRSGLEAQLPSDGTAAFRIATANTSLRVRRVGAARSIARLEDGVLVFPSLWPDTDAYVFATPGGMEELLIAHGDTIPTYEVALPPDWGLRNAPGLPGLVEIRDAFGAAKMRFWAGHAWDAHGRKVACRAPVSGNRIQVLCDGTAPLAIDPEWQSGTTLPLPMEYPTVTQLPTGRVLIAGGDVSDAGLWVEYDPMAGAFTASGAMHHPRLRPTATLLHDGRVLITGGKEVDGATASAELYDPIERTWTETGPMNDARWKHTATRLESGEVLVTGGARVGAVLSSAELYDPASGKFTPIEELDAPRVEHAATALSNGDVLITGGRNESKQALLYRTSTGHFEPAAVMARVRKAHSATVLADGRVLIAGGSDQLEGETDDVELYDPSSDVWVTVSKMSMRRSNHRATALPSGKVLISGGTSAGTPVETAELFNPRTGQWETGESMTAARAAHAALLLPTGKVFVTGGGAVTGVSVSSELFDPGDRETSLMGSMFSWKLLPGTALLPTGDVLVSGNNGIAATTSEAELCNVAQGCRRTATPVHGTIMPSVTPLPSGDVVFTGGIEGDQTTVSAGVEIYRYKTQTFVAPTALLVPRDGHTASLLHNGKILIAGGTDGVHAYNSASILDPETGSIVATGLMAKRRVGHTATTLASGRVLVAGGAGGSSSVFSSMELYDPIARTFSSAGQLSSRRNSHTATRVGDRVLFIGGLAPTAGETILAPTDLIERYDPATQSVEVIGRLHRKRWLHTATLLESGKILVDGGFDPAFPGDGVLETELVDPETGDAELVGTLVNPRPLCGVVALKDGNAMLLGGYDGDVAWLSFEIFDATSKTFSRPADFLGTPRGDQSSELLPDGSVLLAGGSPDSNEARVVTPYTASSEKVAALEKAAGKRKTVLLDDQYVFVVGGASHSTAIADAEIYDIQQRTFESVDPMSSKRQWHALTRLPSGKVLVTGGLDDGFRTLDSAELYVPASRKFEPVGAMHHRRYDHASVLLPSGKVLIVGGKVDGTPAPLPAELFDPATESFQDYDAVTQGGRLRAVQTASGDPLVAGDWPEAAGGSEDGTAFRIHLATDTLQFFSGTPAAPTALLPRVNGETLVCGTRCSRLDMGIGTTWASIEPLENATWSAGFELPSNETFLAGSLEGVPVAMRDRRLDDASAPTILKVQVDIDAGEPELTVIGSRFAESPMAEAQKVPAVSPPLVVFRAAGHATIPLVVRSWTNTSISAACPATVYHGPGWVHVIVDGVASAGTFLVLPPSSLGATCAFDAQCSSGHCVDDVCCDEVCEGACLTCLGAHRVGGGEDGLCGVVAAGLDPRDACERASEDTCGQNGMCDGLGSCGLYADGNPCRTDGRCESGTCLRCNETQDAVIAGESIVSCTPFGCRDGACVNVCTAQTDCAAGHVCGADGQCRPFREAPILADPGACSMALGIRACSRPWAAALLLLGLLRITDRRRRGSSSKILPRRQHLAGNNLPRA